MADVPEIAVTAVRGVRGERKGDPMFSAVCDLRLPGIHGPLVTAPCGDNPQIRGQCLYAQFKADLIVSLSCGAMADGRSILLSGNLYQFFGNQRPGHGSPQEIFILIHSPCLDTGYHILIAELVCDILNIELGSPAGYSPLLQPVQLFLLPAVHTDTDNLIVEILLQPGDDGGGIQSA